MNHIPATGSGFLKTNESSNGLRMPLLEEERLPPHHQDVFLQRNSTGWELFLCFSVSVILIAEYRS